MDKLGTNLASLGTDCISREQAIDALRDWEMCYDWDEHCREEPKEPWVVSPSDVVNKLPPIQPDIVRCKDCKHHWTHRCMDSMPIERCDLGQTFYDAEVDFCSLAEKREVTT